MADHVFNRSLRWLARRRVWVQAAFLLVWLNPLARLHHICGPVFHCYSCPLALFACPIGVLANFSALHIWPFAAIGTLVAIGAIVGNAVCGWMCPFGLLQDLIARLPVPKFQLPSWMGYARYGVLVGLVIGVPYIWGEAHALFFCKVCPVGALEGALPFTVATAHQGGGWIWPSMTKMVVLGATLVGMLFVRRFWCSLLCPLGAIFGLFNRASVVTLRFRSDSCRVCGHCEKMCPYGVLPTANVNTGRCIRCLECTRCGALVVDSVFRSRSAAEEQIQGPQPLLIARACQTCSESCTTCHDSTSN